MARKLTPEEVEALGLDAPDEPQQAPRVDIDLDAPAAQPSTTAQPAEASPLTTPVAAPANPLERYALAAGSGTLPVTVAGDVFGFAPESALRLFGQGAARGNLDEMVGAAESAATDATYEEARDRERQLLASAREDMGPAGSLIAETAGGMVGPRAKGSWGKRTAQSAAEGAIGGAGAAETLAEVPVMMTAGGVIGAGAQQVGEGLTAAAKWGLDKFGPALQDFASRRALAATGYIQKDLKPIMRRNPQGALRKGAAILDEGVIEPGRTVADVAENLEPALAKYGAEMDALLRQADATGAKFDMEPFLAQVDAEILAPIRGDPVVARELAEIDRIVQGYRELAQAKGGLSFAEANALKSRLQKMGINWGNFFSESSPSENAQQFKVHLQNLFLNAIDGQIDDAAGESIGAAFRLAKRQYGTMTEALDKARQGRARMEGNKAFSLTDYMLLGSGITGTMATGDARSAAGGVALGLANKLVRERGSSALAVGGRAIGDVTERAAATMGPDAVVRPLTSAARAAVDSGGIQSTHTWMTDALVQNPEALGPYAQTLAQAQQDGRLASVHYVLEQTDPEYRATLEAARKGL